ncbi:MAG: HAMP domain-containing sensor histidine kinase [Actinomycetota bacterium]
MIPHLAAGRAPIDYAAIRAGYQRVRAASALIVGSVAVVFVSAASASYAIPFAVAAFLVLADAVYRRNIGETAMPSLIVDISIIGATLVVGGAAPSVQVAALAYAFVVAALLLPPRRASIVMVYALVWAATVMAMEGAGLFTATERGGFDGFITIILLIDLVALMSGATRILLEIQDRQRRLLEQERRTVEVKNEFVSMVSHELRTPITGISGFAEMLRDHWRDLPPSEVDEFLTILRGESDHLANLVEDILVIPRLEAGQLRLHIEQVVVLSIAEAVADIVFDDRSLIEIDIPVYVTVWSDSVRLRQVLRNLLENALKYGGNEVHVFGEERREGIYTVIVADNGAGVAEADQERIFEHFEQLSKGDARIEQGVGLGLPIARKLARAMGGDLWYEERFPVGAAFCFDVDLVKEADVIDGSDAGVSPVGIEAGAHR